jgi:hypothetical protein
MDSLTWRQRHEEMLREAEKERLSRAYQKANKGHGREGYGVANRTRLHGGWSDPGADDPWCPSDARGGAAVRALAVMVRAVLVLMAALFGAVAGTVALLGTATITAWPPLFLLAGLAAFCAAYLTGLLLATRDAYSCQ